MLPALSVEHPRFLPGMKIRWVIATTRAVRCVLLGNISISMLGPLRARSDRQSASDLSSSALVRQAKALRTGRRVCE